MAFSSKNARHYFTISALVPTQADKPIEVQGGLTFVSALDRAAFAAELALAMEPLAVVWVEAPTSRTSAGLPGMIARSEDYFYVYVGDGETHEWGRVPMVREW